ncbi:polysaccharide biosynthesis protein CapD [Methanococcus vannielii SB]|uniref:Polysaccharide biosynthesis protein CapD n=1 Tax=Methanococcus vannielii (strain ATCC 35089 / DSM 1224 / JCM 13029 / OCM 148 / SB) TaxID=406327 RepID=A6UP96_METVS|nr:polysaccharide biosynthesis protein [Methanococcus vannielii]ABR54318.1 polysaccharide biosynthesis protein CapD [Methanococcus vannielii SB]
MDNEKAIIIGAGGAGKELLNEFIAGSYPINILGFIDDNVTESIKSFPILGKIENLKQIIPKYGIKIVFIAMPATEGELLKKIYLECIKFPVKIKLIPRYSEILLNRVNLTQLREISVEDIIGKKVTKKMFENISKKVEGKTFIVFGAAGSIGSKLCQQIASLCPKKLIMVDWSENGMFYLEDKINKIIKTNDKVSLNNFSYYIGNIQDEVRMNQIIGSEKPDVIINAAAYKHVPLMELNYYEAIKNNVMGSKNLYEIAIKHQVKNFILISSDKAVNPTNIMGVTKRITEKMMHYYASLDNSKTSFLAVRFGNVINSNGSVIPTFQKQIREGRITITHKDIIRYFMSIDEAVYLILQCWVQGTNDEIFVLDMGEPIKIIDLATLMIKIAGLELDKDVKLEFIGLRPGEKLYEEPLTKIEETLATKNDKIYILKRDEEFDHKEFIDTVTQLVNVSGEKTFDEVKPILKKLVPTYKEFDMV